MFKVELDVNLWSQPRISILPWTFEICLHALLCSSRPLLWLRVIRSQHINLDCCPP